MTLKCWTCHSTMVHPNILLNCRSHEHEPTSPSHGVMENYVGYFEIKPRGQGQATTIQLQLNCNHFRKKGWKSLMFIWQIWCLLSIKPFFFLLIKKKELYCSDFTFKLLFSNMIFSLWELWFSPYRKTLPKDFKTTRDNRGKKLN